MQQFLNTRIAIIQTHYAENAIWHAAGNRSAHYFAYQYGGNFDHTINGKVYTAKAGMLLFLNKRDAYDVVMHENGLSISFWLEGEIEMPSFFLKCSDNDLPQLFNSLLQHKNLRLESNYYYCFSVLCRAISAVKREQEMDYMQSSDRNRIWRIKNYIDENYSDPTIDNRRLAELCGVGEHYMSELFRRNFGSSPIHYLLMTRLEIASTLLEMGGYSVAQIAEQVGFSDSFYFSRVFKKYRGVTPTEYRRGNK